MFCRARSTAENRYNAPHHFYCASHSSRQSLTHKTAPPTTKPATTQASDKARRPEHETRSAASASGTSRGPANSVEGRRGQDEGARSSSSPTSASATRRRTVAARPVTFVFQRRPGAGVDLVAPRHGRPQARRFKPATARRPRRPTSFSQRALVARHHGPSSHRPCRHGLRATPRRAKKAASGSASPATSSRSPTSSASISRVDRWPSPKFLAGES